MKKIFLVVVVWASLMASCTLKIDLSQGSFQLKDLYSDEVFANEGLLLERKVTEGQDVCFFDVTLSDTLGRDRAVTMSYFMLPVRGKGWRWLLGLSEDKLIDDRQEYLSQNGDFHPLSFNNDAVGACQNPLSRYPFAAITDGRHGIGIGIDLSYPAVYRLGFNGESGKFYISYDIGLTQECSKAKLRFITFKFDPKWGFRGALARYYEIFPDYFANRVPSPNQGLWMPAGKVSEVQNWEDFGFRFKEGDNETKWDNASGLLTFHYIEPMSWWMKMDHKKLPSRNACSAEEYEKMQFGAIMDELRRLSETEGIKDRAKSVLSSVFYNVDGTPYYGVTDMPWCTGVLWGLNSMPGIIGEYTDFKNKWNAKLREKLFGNQEKDGILGGIYIDSAEGFVGYLDYCREHFSVVKTPLTFDRKYHRPAIFRGLIAYEFIRQIAEDVHRMGKLMMANQTPSELCWLAPLLDIMGTETDWYVNGKWTPMPLEDLFFRRAMCKTKPYCFLMNTDFDVFPQEYMEKFMKRSLAFGISPGCFSADAANKQYFTIPELYNRDRDLFKKYVPLCNLLAEAGWDPIPKARSNDKRIHVERFGDSFLTVLNDSREKLTARISLEGQEPITSRELLSGTVIRWKNNTAEFPLEGDDVAVIELVRSEK